MNGLMPVRPTSAYFNRHVTIQDERGPASLAPGVTTPTACW